MAGPTSYQNAHLRHVASFLRRCGFPCLHRYAAFGFGSCGMFKQAQAAKTFCNQTALRNTTAFDHQPHVQTVSCKLSLIRNDRYWGEPSHAACKKLLNVRQNLDIVWLEHTPPNPPWIQHNPNITHEDMTPLCL